MRPVPHAHRQVCSFSESHSLLPSQDLYEAGELKWGTDEAQFIYILGNRSKQHLRLGEFLKTEVPPQVLARPVAGSVISYQVIIWTVIALPQDRVLHGTHDTTDVTSQPPHQSAGLRLLLPFDSWLSVPSPSKVSCSFVAAMAMLLDVTSVCPPQCSMSI